MIQTITLRHLLPCVFAGMEQSEAIRRSQVWLADELRLERGCRLCIRAESGGGKSSLLSFLYGNRTDYRGTIEFDGTDVRTFSADRWCDVRIGGLALLPQEMRLFPELTVRRNIALKNRLTAHKTEREILDLLARLGLADKVDMPVGRLSIGQQQRVAVVRAVCQPFDFILLDEPVSHLDERNNRLVADIVDAEARAQGAGVVSTSVGNPLLLDGARYVEL